MTNYATPQSATINAGSAHTTTATIGGSKLPQVVPSSLANTYTIGDLENNNTLSAYVASQLVSFSLTNMRPSTRMYVYLNSVNVTQYCCPGYITDDSSPEWANTVQQAAPFGQPITTDANGQCSAILSIPPAVFKQGDYVLEVCDSNTFSQGNTSFTTISSAPITFGQLAVTKPISTPTTTNPLWSFLPTDKSITTSYTDPLAQCFTIANKVSGYTSGCFMTSVDLFIAAITNIRSNGVAVYICETTSTSGSSYIPDETKILPFSWVHLDSYYCIPDLNCTISTKFTFDSPVYLKPGTTYALVIKPDGGDTNYKFRVGTIGSIDSITGNKISSVNITFNQAFIGSTKGWNTLANQVFKLNLNIATFSTQSNSGIILTPTNTDYITALNFVFPNTAQANTINPGDWAFQAANGYANATGAAITSSANGIVRYWDNLKCVLYVDQSTGGFLDNSCVQIHRFANSTLSTANQTTLVCYANTYMLYDPIADLMSFNSSAIVPENTAYYVSMISGYKPNTAAATGATAYTYVTGNTNVSIGTEVALTNTVVIPSYSHALAYNVANTQFFVQFVA